MSDEKTTWRVGESPKLGRGDIHLQPERGSPFGPCLMTTLVQRVHGRLQLDVCELWIDAKRIVEEDGEKGGCLEQGAKAVRVQGLKVSCAGIVQWQRWWHCFQS